MPEHAALLFANEAFYVAFAARDIEAMEAAWADLPSISCIHPGWMVLAGRERVLGSWRSILANPDAPRVTCLSPEAHLIGDAGYVTCVEGIDRMFLAATNIFVRQNGLWKMRHHHASPAPAPATAGAPPPPVIQ